MIYDDWEDLEGDMDEEWLEEFEEDEEEPVIVVRFLGNGSTKNYHYFTDDFSLEKGDKLRIRTGGPNGMEAKVIVIGYMTHSPQAARSLNIIGPYIEENNRKPKYEKEGKVMKPMKKKLKKATDVALNAAVDAKDTAIKLQKGNSVIVAIKTAIYTSDMVPVQVKTLIDAGGGISDLLIGLGLEIAANTFTESETIQEAAKCANFSGAISASSDFTFIQESIEKVVASAVGATNKKMNVKDESEPDGGTRGEDQDG